MADKILLRCLLFQETRNEIAPPNDICLALLIAQAMCGKAFTRINFLDGPFTVDFVFFLIFNWQLP